MENKWFLLLPGIQPQFICYSALRIVTVLTHWLRSW